MGTSFGRAEQWARPRVTLISDVPVASVDPSESEPAAARGDYQWRSAALAGSASMKRTVILTPGRGDPEAACPSRPGRVRPHQLKEPSGKNRQVGSH